MTINANVISFPTTTTAPDEPKLVLSLKKKRKTKAAPVRDVEASVAASEWRRLSVELNLLKAELAKSRKELMKKVEVIRDEALREGTCESVHVGTSDGNKVLVVFQERFSGIGIENVAALKGAFGLHYDVLVTETAKVSLARGTTLEAIEEAIGARAMAKLADADLLNVTEQVTPRKGAYAAIAAAYEGGETTLAQHLSTLVEACVTAPSIRVG